VLAQRGPTERAHRKIKKEAAILDHTSVLALAKLVAWCFANRPVGRKPFEQETIAQHVKELITNIVEGWHLRSRHYLTHQEWYVLSDVFVQKISEAFGTFGFSGRLRFQRAFLLGVQAGFSDWVTKRKEGRCARGEKRCKAFGIDSVDDIMDAALDPTLNRSQAFIYQTPAENARIQHMPVPAASSSTSSPLTHTRSSKRRRQLADDDDDDVQIIIPKLSASTMRDFDVHTSEAKTRSSQTENANRTPSKKQLGPLKPLKNRMLKDLDELELEELEDDEDEGEEGDIDSDDDWTQSRYDDGDVFMTRA